MAGRNVGMGLRSVMPTSPLMSAVWNAERICSASRLFFSSSCSAEPVAPRRPVQTSRYLSFQQSKSP
jgi:hypothetical protein